MFGISNGFGSYLDHLLPLKGEGVTWEIKKAFYENPDWDFVDQFNYIFSRREEIGEFWGELIPCLKPREAGSIACEIVNLIEFECVPFELISDLVELTGIISGETTYECGTVLGKAEDPMQAACLIEGCSNKLLPLYGMLLPQGERAPKYKKGSLIQITEKLKGFSHPLLQHLNLYLHAISGYNLRSAVALGSLPDALAIDLPKGARNCFWNTVKEELIEPSEHLSFHSSDDFSYPDLVRHLRSIGTRDAKVSVARAFIPSLEDEWEGENLPKLASEIFKELPLEESIHFLEAMTEKNVLSKNDVVNKLVRIIEQVTEKEDFNPYETVGKIAALSLTPDQRFKKTDRVKGALNLLLDKLIEQKKAFLAYQITCSTHLILREDVKDAFHKEISSLINQKDRTFLLKELKERHAKGVLPVSFALDELFKADRFEDPFPSVAHFLLRNGGKVSPKRVIEASEKLLSRAEMGPMPAYLLLKEVEQKSNLLPTLKAIAERLSGIESPFGLELLREVKGKIKKYEVKPGRHSEKEVKKKERPQLKFDTKNALYNTVSMLRNRKSGEISSLERVFQIASTKKNKSEFCKSDLKKERRVTLFKITRDFIEKHGVKAEATLKSFLRSFSAENIFSKPELLKLRMAFIKTLLRDAENFFSSVKFAQNEFDKELKSGDKQQAVEIIQLAIEAAAGHPDVQKKPEVFQKLCQLVKTCIQTEYLPKQELVQLFGRIVESYPASHKKIGSFALPLKEVVHEGALYNIFKERYTEYYQCIYLLTDYYISAPLTEEKYSHTIEFMTDLVAHWFSSGKNNNNEENFLLSNDVATKIVLVCNEVESVERSRLLGKYFQSAHNFLVLARQSGAYTTTTEMFIRVTAQLQRCFNYHFNGE